MLISRKGEGGQIDKQFSLTIDGLHIFITVTAVIIIIIIIIIIITMNMSDKVK
jgi:hypothetical protein